MLNYLPDGFGLEFRGESLGAHRRPPMLTHMPGMTIRAGIVQSVLQSARKYCGVAHSTLA